MNLDTTTTRKVLLTLGRLEEGREELKQALELMDEDRINKALNYLNTQAGFLVSDTFKMTGGK